MMHDESFKKASAKLNAFLKSCADELGPNASESRLLKCVAAKITAHILEKIKKRPPYQP